MQLRTPTPRFCATSRTTMSPLMFVSGMGWAMINPDKYCCFYCPITSAKGSSQEYKQPEARCPAGHLERISCHHGCTVSLVHEHLCQLRFNFACSGLSCTHLSEVLVDELRFIVKEKIVSWFSPAEVFLSS